MKNLSIGTKVILLADKMGNSYINKYTGCTGVITDFPESKYDYTIELNNHDISRVVFHDEIELAYHKLNFKL